MRRVVAILFLLSVLTACARSTETPASAPVIPTDASLPATPVADPVTPTFSAPVEPSVTAAASEDVFSRMGITLPEPTCSGLTQSQTEGPYYKPDTPERTSFLEEDMQGTRLILAGYVLDQNCQPLPDAWLDFWQADANGEYDNAGYRLRGHQFTDAQGRYYLGQQLDKRAKPDECRRLDLG